MPIMTMLEMKRSPPVGKPSPLARVAPNQSPRRSRATMIWPTISPGVRLRTSRCVPVWQNEQVPGQPQEPLARTIDRDLLGHDLGAGEREVPVERCAQLLRHAGHLFEPPNAA